MKTLDQIVALANAIALKHNGIQTTCILTSYALVEVLRRLGHDAYPVRVEAAV
jgi:hypothetical protein